MGIYLDNSATTPLDPEVFETMRPYLTDFYGNPSSTHAQGRAARSAIEAARKKVAGLINASPSEIYFTSGGTESDNMAIRGLVGSHGIRHIISTRIEHHAVLHTIGDLKRQGLVDIHFLDLDESGCFDRDQLAELLRQYPHSLVSLMHANNEIGNLIDMHVTGQLCREFDCFFHSDTVPTIGRYLLDLKSIPVDAILGSAHKFHGPKGVGFLYLRSGIKATPLLYGGGQERDMRPGTENVAGIVGLAKALETALNQMDKNREHITSLKKRMISGLKAVNAPIAFNGMSGDITGSLYSLVNLSLPFDERNDMTLFQLDLKGIAASGGSACGSGALKGSHVINEIRKEEKKTINIRFSFSKFNTMDEIDYTLAAMNEILN